MENNKILKGNVLVVGNSGVGKSTLINAILNDANADTGFGSSGTTKEIKTYENNIVPFRLIDTAGFEHSKRKIHHLVKNINKNCKDRAKDGNTDTDINVIWFCVDGAAAKLFEDTIKEFLQATSVWKTVPIIVVITKSYDSRKIEDSIDMVNKAFSSIKRNTRFPQAIIPVIAEPLFITADSFASPFGVSELIEETNKLLPLGFKAAEKDVKEIILQRKDVTVDSLIYSATAAASAIGAIPIPIADAALLVPLETGVIKSIALVYDIPKDEKAIAAFNTIIELGTVGAVAKAAIGAIKTIPGLKIAASIINAIVAGSIVMGLGEGCKYIYREIYLGNKSIDDIDWITKVMNTTVATQVNEFAKNALNQLTNTDNADDVKKVLLNLLAEGLKLGSSITSKEA